MSALPAILLVSCAALAGREDPVEAWFPRLEAASWADRELAQRRLAAELGPGDAARVRAAIQAGGAETRLRLAHVLGDEDRLYGAAAELAVDADAEVARAGLTALRLAIERFEPYAYSEPIPREDLWTALAEHDGALIDARAAGRFEPGELADLLAVLQPRAPRIAFDGPATTAPGARRPLGGGAWRLLARDAASQAGGRLVGYGVRREPAPYEVRWLAVVARDAEGTDPRAGDLVERWSLDFARAGNPDARASAARALCAYGAPPAVEWIARRFRATRDDAALEGLLLAARRGDVPAVLQEEFARRHLWSELERAADLDGPRALHAALALAGVGLPQGPDAEAEIARALADLDTQAPSRARLVLVALEGWASPRSPDRIGSAVRGLLARPELAVGLRFGALRVAARLGVRERVAGDPAALFLAAHASGHAGELARLLRGTADWPPDAWAGDAAGPALEVLLRAEDVRVALVSAWLARGAVEPAALALGRLVSGAARATERLRDLAPLEPRLREAVDRAAAARGLPAAEAETWRVACGVATGDERHARLAALELAPPVTDLEWAALADLCAGPTGGAARERLVELLPSAPPETALSAAQRAVQALRADLDDAAERAFLQAVRGAIRTERGSPLDLAFRGEAWPPPPTAPLRALREVDRDPARGPR